MANYNQAPKLTFNGEKNNKQFYQIPQDLADIIFNELGNSSAQLRIMMVLIGTKEGFAISDKWICDRTGLQHESYIRARKELVKKGWLIHKPSEGIEINIKKIYSSRGNTILPESSNTILPQRGNTILPQPSDTILPITYNQEIKTENKTDERENQEQGKLGTQNNPYLVKKEWLIKRHNAIQKCANGLFYYNKEFYKEFEL